MSKNIHYCPYCGHEPIVMLCIDDLDDNDIKMYYLTFCVNCYHYALSTNYFYNKIPYDVSDWNKLCSKEIRKHKLMLRKFLKRNFNKKYNKYNIPLEAKIERWNIIAKEEHSLIKEISKSNFSMKEITSMINLPEKYILNCYESFYSMNDKMIKIICDILDIDSKDVLNDRNIWRNKYKINFY